MSNKHGQRNRLGALAPRIRLTEAEIEAALPLIADGLCKYVWIQSHLNDGDIRDSAVFRVRFNHFYRVRRGAQWQSHFYSLMESKKGEQTSFGDVLATIHGLTNRYEASFASKLVATINPSMPVIDSVVLANLNLRLPNVNTQDRMERITEMHGLLLTAFHAFLATETGTYLVKRFKERYPAADLTDIKKLDFVIWQTRPSVNAKRKSMY